MAAATLSARRRMRGIACCALAAMLLALAAPAARGADGAAPDEVSVEKQPLRRPASTAPPAGSSTEASPPRAPMQLDLPRVLGAMGIVLALILGLRWAARRLYPGLAPARSSQAVRVLARTPIGPKQQFMLVQLGRRILLIANTGAQMNTLSEIIDPEEAAEVLGRVQEERTDSLSRAFSSLFRQAERKFDEPEAPAGPEKGSGTVVRSTLRAVPATVHDPFSGPQEPPPAPADDPELAGARAELQGLAEKVRLLSRQFKA